MPKAYIQLGASGSSPSICPARATGCVRSLYLLRNHSVHNIHGDLGELWEVHEVIAISVDDLVDRVLQLHLC